MKRVDPHKHCHRRHRRRKERPERRPGIPDTFCTEINKVFDQSERGHINLARVKIIMMRSGLSDDRIRKSAIGDLLVQRGLLA